MCSLFSAAVRSGSRATCIAGGCCQLPGRELFASHLLENNFAPILNHFYCTAEYVSASAAASALEIPAEQCQLLLYTLAAVGGKAGADAAVAAGGPSELGGASIYDLSLFLMAQLYSQEVQKPETKDHWPDPASNTCPGAEAAALKCGPRAAQQQGGLHREGHKLHTVLLLAGWPWLASVWFCSVYIYA